MLLLIALTLKARGLAPPWLGDFRVYRSAAQAVLDGSPLYDLAVSQADSGSLLFTYPPFAAVLAIPFALLGANAAGTIFYLLCFPILIVICVLVARQLAPIAGRTLPWTGIPLAVIVLAIAFLERPVTHVFYLGQIGLVLMLLILLDTLVVKRWNGVLTGIATGIKVTPAVFLLLMATTRRWSDLLRGLVTFAVTVLIGFAVQPGESWRYWTALIFDSSRVGEVDRTDNMSLLGIVVRATDSGVGQLIWLVVAAATLIVGTWLATAWWPRERLVSVSVMAVTGLLISPITWDHHWVWAIAVVPVFAMLAVRGWFSGTRRSAWLPALAALAVFAVAVVHPESFAAHILSTTGSLTILAQVLAAMYCVAGLLVLAAAWSARRFYPVTESVPLTSVEAHQQDPAKGS